MPDAASCGARTTRWSRSAHAFEYEDLIPDARAVVFPRTGHAPMLEEPERFNAALLGFLHEDARR